MKLSIVIPAYNEEARLRPTLEGYLDYFQRIFGEDFECILVVNGSVDQTESIAREVGQRYPCLRIDVEPRSIGKGGAVMRGFDLAHGEFVGFVDADGATGPEAYEDLVNHIGDAGMILASRWMPGAVVEPRQGLPRRIASRLFNRLVRLFFGVKLTDTQCGAKLLSRKALDTIRPHLGLTRWAFDVDLVFQVRRCGFSLTEHPTVWRDVSGSKLNVPRASLEMLIAICRLRLLYSPFRFLVRLYDISLGHPLHRGVE